MAEFTGRNVDEAIETGLQTLGLTRNQVEIEVLNPGRSGIFGLGASEARVLLRPIGEQEPEPQATATEPIPVPEPTQPIAAAETTVDSKILEILELSRSLLQDLLDHMGLQARVDATLQPPSGPEHKPVYLLNIEGADLGILIGRRAETLDSLQYLVRLMVNRQTYSWHYIEVDVEHYRERRQRSLERLAETMAERAVRDGRRVILEAMPARERRIIHLTLRDRDDVYTESVGEGEHRKVTIVPRSPA